MQAMKKAGDEEAPAMKSMKAMKARLPVARAICVNKFEVVGRGDDVGNHEDQDHDKSDDSLVFVAHILLVGLSLLSSFQQGC